MLFNSWGYIAFLLIGTSLFHFMPKKTRIYLLCTLSLGFYGMWRWEFISLILISSVVDFSMAKKIAVSERQESKRKYLLVSLICNLSLLILFKYTYFIWDNISLLGGVVGSEFPSLDSVGIRIILPLGISFYTFQTISYSIDVYRGVYKPEPKFIYFLTYVCFWPQLIAGPILRASEVLDALKKDRDFCPDMFSSGLFRIIIGLSKKVILADMIAPLVNTAFGVRPSIMTGFDVWVATILFGFQIYFDFSAYSDIAIGSARMLGLKFPENFNWPYSATNAKDFWKRWHISLSSWIRDYLYLPLVGSKFQTSSQGGIAVASDNKGKMKALFLTWFIMGLWHGASWNFALWGLYHATVIFFFRFSFIDNFEKKYATYIWPFSYLIFMAGWIPFRATDLSHSFTMFGKILNPFSYGFTYRQVTGASYLTAFILTLSFYFLYKIKNTAFARNLTHGKVFHITLVACLTLLMLIYLKPVEQFIYFQF